MMWYTVQFDKNWVRCRNSKCQAEFIKDGILRRRKCPSCKMNNQGCITRKAAK